MTYIITHNVSLKDLKSLSQRVKSISDTATTLNTRTKCFVGTVGGYYEPHVAAVHNSIYRGKNLGTRPSDAQIAAIRNGTYDDIYVGDFWYDSASKCKYYVAHCGYYLHIGYNNTDSADYFYKPHVTVIDDGYTRDPTASSNTVLTAGWDDGIPATGFYGTPLYSALNEFETKIRTAWGDILLKHPRIISNGYNSETGAVTSYRTEYVYIDTPTERQIYGNAQYSKEFDTYNSTRLAIANYLHRNIVNVWGGKPGREIAGIGVICKHEHGHRGSTTASRCREFRTMFNIG